MVNVSMAPTTTNTLRIKETHNLLQQRSRAIGNPQEMPPLLRSYLKPHDIDHLWG